MRIPIRVISVATAVIWAFLILFSITAIYSMKDLRVNLGQMQVNSEQGSQLVLSFPVSIVNTGFYNLDQFNVSTVVFNANGSMLAQGFTSIPTVLHEQTVNVTHDLDVNLTDLVQTNRDMLFSDSQLTANMSVNMRAAGAIPIRASSNITIPWGAPFYNLVIGNPEFSAYNSTYSRVVVPVSFENHAFFNLTGSVRLRMYDNSNMLLARTRISLDVPQYSPYNGIVELFVPLRVTSIVHFELFFVLPFLNFGPLVVPYGT